MKTKNEVNIKGSKRLFFKLGSCSRTMAFIINREFDNLSEPEERALDPLAGGILQQGYQCGMLWGAALAIGAEAFKTTGQPGNAETHTLLATRDTLTHFISRAKSPDCFDITKCDWHSKSSIAKYFVSGKVVTCYKLLEKWAPEAVISVDESLEKYRENLPSGCENCASQLVKKMGGSELEMTMVAGFAGGLGLSGNACGALAAAIWKTTLELCKKEPGKSFYNNKQSTELLELFYQITNYEILCKDIVKRDFKGVEDHSEYIRSGGCKELIDRLSKS